MVVCFDDTGKILPKDALKWARSVALEWGEINSQTKVKAPSLPGPVWWFSCSGHGGYILVCSSDKVPQALHKFATDGILTWGKDWVETFGKNYNNVTVFKFEEDCDYACFELAYPEVARWAVYDCEQGWARNPSTINDGIEEPLDEKRSQLAKERLGAPETMELLVAERIESACKSIRTWQNKELAEKLLNLGAA